MSNYLIVYSDHLSHHGIKGQKWGERRFQNEDGSLTEAGKARYNVHDAKRAFADGGIGGYIRYRKTHTGRYDAIAEYKKEKHIAKMTKYRDKLANRAQMKKEYNKSTSKKHTEAAEDLQKNGKNSKTYKKYVEQEMRRRDFERDIDGVNKNWRSLASLADYMDMNSQYTSKITIAKLNAEHNEQAKIYKSRAQKWGMTNKKLMNTPISEVTTKRDLRRVYRS